jgi:nickel/cobalt transporter (NicO) family protein
VAHGALFPTLAATAVTIGSLHTAAPDHWLPFAALARARGWSARRTAGVTLLCGFGHVTVSALLGFLGLFLGVAMLESFGRRLGSLAPFLLIGFGVLYGLWGLKRAVAPCLHGHSHAHYDHVHDPSQTSAWTLFLLFSADPCVAVVPLLFATAPLGAARAVAVVLLYESATLATMLTLVTAARAGSQRLRAPWLDRYGDAAAGGLIAAAGLLVAGLGW